MHIKMPEENTEEKPNFIVFEEKRPRTKFSIPDKCARYTVGGYFDSL